MDVPSIRAVQALDVALSVHQPSVVAQLVADLERSRAEAADLLARAAAAATLRGAFFWHFRARASIAQPVRAYG